MERQQISLISHSTVDTIAIAQQLKGQLSGGDTILLTGDIGAGKSFFCRALIQSLLETPEDVPSPTYTLVQTYHAKAFEIWHADLYRIGSLDEIDDLGLFNAFETALCLIEWPDRLGEEAPGSALSLELSASVGEDTTRSMYFTWSDPKWDTKLKGFCQ